ncbi:MAG: restriction endonuclease subunit S [Blautia sp.]|nr:restriction endonuclease subunit S [Blautia sp.]
MREMKDSGTPWCDKIPSNWQALRLKYVMNNYDSQRMPVDAGKRSQEGDILYDYYGASGVIDSIDGYTHTGRRILIGEDGANLVLRNLPLIYIADGKYWVNNHAHILAPKYGWSLDYFAHQMEVIDYFEYITGAAQPKLSQGNLSKVCLVVPPVEEQYRIADFLNKKCTEIDALSADIQSEIDTLEAYKRSVITEAVTKGLDKNVAMKDSGTPWCPRIPSHWQYTNPKALFTQRFDRAYAGERQLTASQEYGIVYQDEFMEMTGNRVVTVMKDFSILKHVEPGDFVISMRSFQGGLEYSEVKGCISSAYVMLVPNNKLVYPPFYRWFFKSDKYINAIQSTSNLVRDGQAMRYANFVQVPLFIIPLNEQKKIAEYLNTHISEIDEIKRQKQEQLAILADYKKSIIYEYVTGKKEVPSA